MEVRRPESEEQRRVWLLIAQHAREMRKPKERRAAWGEGEVRCELCGCAGNQECGHEPLNRGLGCTIDPDEGWCPCCGAVHLCTQAEVEAIMEWYEVEVEGQRLLEL